MTIHAVLKLLTEEIQGQWTVDRDGFRLEAVLAERKAFLSRKKLMYQARIRIDETARKAILSERLKETGLGLAGDLESTPGIGFKKETYRVGLDGVRSGTIEEQYRLIGTRYVIPFEFGDWREKIRQALESHGFELELRVF
jgi:hypothetical protein